MDAIFHEKQEGSLCAQHCLNALLQEPYYTAVELAALAQQLDDEERLRMAESGLDSEEYRTFLQQPSGNMDDSGYFSVQVISSALKVWGLELVPYTSAEARAREAFASPEKMQAFICHYKNHWFTIRKIAGQWFNLNSLLSRPESISSTYLSLFLAQLQQEGYSIFIVFGDLPKCRADEVLRLRPANQEDDDLQRAMAMSLGECSSSRAAMEVPSASSDDSDEVQLRRAINMSLQDDTNSEEVDDEEAQLKTAIQMSLESISI